MKSIVCDDRQCWVCGNPLNLEKHHVYKGPNRPLAEKYGCFVYLCHYHHTRPVKIYFVWNEAERRRDPDNITAAQKFLLDELVRLKKIPNDTSKWVKGIYHDFTFGGDYKVTIYLEEQ